jgi:hypothetical protein
LAGIVEPVREARARGMMLERLERPLPARWEGQRRMLC